MVPPIKMRKNNIVRLLITSMIIMGIIMTILMSKQLPQNDTHHLNKPTVPLYIDREIKTARCSQNFDRSMNTLNLIQVANESSIPKHEKILCFVNTISTNHRTKAQAIFETWGRKCDKLLFGSNETDESIGAIKIDARSTHDFLWEKHKATIRYIWERYRDEYTWFYKADDDAYIIMENLRKYLLSPEISTLSSQVPLQLGHRFSLPESLVDYYVVDESLRNAFKRKFGTWIFNSGGPGYAMNKLYMQLAVDSFDKFNCLSDYYSDMLPDDASISFCMAWNGVLPMNTRDEYGKERWHADKPSGAYFATIDDPDYWFVQYHAKIGGIKNGENCCSADTIAFHYMTPAHMYYVEDQLYYCRNDAIESVLDRRKGLPVDKIER